MKKLLLASAVLIFSFANSQQNSNNLFTLVRKLGNPGYPPNPGSVRTGTLNPTSGLVTNTGTGFYTGYIIVSGGALNAVTNKYNQVTSTSSVLSFDILDGTFNEVPILSFHSGTTYFDNVSFCNSNNNFYGLARTYSNQNQINGMYLGTLNTNTGVLTAVSQNSIGNGYALNGKAIDPNQMVYYYSTATKFMGIDIYDGTVYSNPDIVYSGAGDFNFGNFTYNCNDGTIYGLTREMTTIQNPNLPAGVNIQLMRLAKINPSTGLVTRISQTPLPVSVYEFGAASTISGDVYYFHSGDVLYGISLTTGLVVTSTPLTFQDGNYVFCISNYDYCLGATASRLSNTLGINDNKIQNKINIYPNPTFDKLNIESVEKPSNIEVYDSSGRKVKTILLNTNSIDVKNLEAGVYFVKVLINNIESTYRFIKI